jgi:protein-S-isoprenylcysteine O-methyltransferase Ste14
MLVSLGVCIYVGYLLWKPFVAVSPDVSPILRVVGLVLFLAGDFVILWARWTLGKNWSISTSYGVQLQTDHKLIQRGPFALVRHPMYTGFWTMLVGAMLAYHTWAVLILLLMALAIFYRRAGLEEAALADTFGEQWRTYTAHVPRFVPRLR